MEKWDAYDKYRRKVGVEVIRGEPLPDGVRHLVVHMIFVNSKGRILLQRRAFDKPLAPGVWAFTGGSALAGESAEEACIRETEEEMGFTPQMENAEKIISFARPDAFVDVFLIKCNLETKDLHLQKEEVADAAWFTYEELVCMADNPAEFWKHSYFDMAISYLKDMKYI